MANRTQPMIYQSLKPYVHHNFLYMIFGVVISCTQTNNQILSLGDQVQKSESISGNDDYTDSPYVTAGDRVYMVGHQDGTFPDRGWHVDGEMGGIWDHPIKLMDGFYAQIISGEDTICLDKANKFINYPIANQHQYSVRDIDITRTQFVPDSLEGMVIEYSFKSNSAQNIGFVFTGMVDLMPTWLSERLEITDGADEIRYNQDNEAMIAKDKLNNWFVAFGADKRPDFHGTKLNHCDISRKGKGTNGSLMFELMLRPNTISSIRLFISGSDNSVDDAWRTFNHLKSNSGSLFDQKAERYNQIKSKSALTIGDKKLEQAYRWVKYNTDWLMRDVPEIGRGLSAGIDDYPWWFGADNAYSIQGMLAIGAHEDALSTIDLIMSLSREVNNSNGRIMHEASTNGGVYNPGNLNETPHFIYTLWKAYEWTGDQSIIEKYADDVIKGIEWIEAEDKDGNGYPDGPGMMEIHGLHSEMIDVVVYQQQAYEAASKFIAEVDPELAQDYAHKAGKLRRKINSEWWVEEFKSYADFRSTPQQAIELIDAAISRADTINISEQSKENVKEELLRTKSKIRNDQSGTQGYVVHHNWVVNTPMEMGVADPEKAQIALETARNYRNRFGMFVTGMDRNEDQEQAEKWKAFSYVGAVMTLPTGVQAISEARYGNPDESLKYLEMLTNSFSYALPGSMYEVSPDYGMMVQAWNVYALATPIVEHFFGIKPQAHQKRILIQPQMPTSWTNVSLENVKIGDNEISIVKSTEEGVETYQITQKFNWEIEFDAGEFVRFNDKSKSISIDNI
ncbi:MAG: glycogen debranching protein [Cyclobacteriaceae bacterium]